MVPEPAPPAPSGAELLRGLSGGAVHLPGDPLYDEARMPWNLQVDEHPAAVAYPADPQEVARIVKAAAASAGLRVAPQGTGHGAPPLAGRLGDAVLLRTSAMTGLRVDATRPYGAGRRPACCWGDVVARAGRVGLAGAAHVQPGGRRGRLVARRRGELVRPAARPAVQRDHGRRAGARRRDVRARHRRRTTRTCCGRRAAAAAASGSSRRWSSTCCRCATAYAGMLAWDWRHARRVLTAWGEWTEAAPESVTSVARIFQVPDCRVAARRAPRAQAGDDRRGRAGGRRGGRAVLAPLRALRPGGRHVRTGARADIVAHLQLDPQEPTAVYANSVLVDALPGGRGRRPGRDGRPRVGQQPALRRAAPARRRPGAAGPARRGARPPGRLLPGARRRASTQGTGWARRARGRHAGDWTRSRPGPPGRRTSRWPTRPSRPDAAGRRRRTTAWSGSAGRRRPRRAVRAPPRPAPTGLRRAGSSRRQVRLKPRVHVGRVNHDTAPPEEA